MMKYQEKLESLAERGFFSLAVLEVTTRCNLSCEYCYVDSHDRELSTDEWKLTIDRLAEAGVVAVTLTGGEPFCRSDILELLEHVFRRGFFQTSLLTNGTMLKPRQIAFLGDNKALLHNVRISFFSHKASVHDAFSGVSGSFDRSLSNATALRDAGVQVAVMINATTDNVDTFQESKAYFQKQGFSVHEGLVKFLSNDTVRTTCLPAVEKVFFRRYLSQFTPSMLQVSKAELAAKCNECGEDDYLCKAVLGMIGILADGAIVPCISFRKHPIGNVLEYSGALQTLYAEAPLVRKLHSLRRKDVVPCNSCKYRSFCILCPGMMLQEHGSLQKPSEQNCNYVKALEEA